MFRSPRPDIAPGLAASIAIAVAATAIGAIAPVAGSAVPAIVLGLAIGIAWPARSRIGGAAAFRAGGAAASGPLLRVAIVLLGTQLPLDAIARAGAAALPVMLSSLVVCFASAPLVGRLLGVGRRLRLLITAGTGICGASAIATIAPVIGATGAEVAYALSTILAFNLAAVGVFPLLGHALGLDANAFALLAGTAVNDTSSVVAAAGVFGGGAVGAAVAVKLVRMLAIVPVAAALSVVEARRAGAARMTPRRVARLVPWFLVGFVLAALARWAGWLPAVVQDAAGQTSGFLIAAALAGIGLSTDLGAIRRAGWRPLALGGILSVLVAVTTLTAMAATGAM
ncbi:YeiH family protein [Microbacterium sp. NPDC055683]